MTREGPRAEIDAEGTLLIGRGDHVAALEDAFLTPRRGHAVTMLVHGASGMGKTALTRHVVSGFVARGALVLEGRCYDREPVPYKALDALAYALADFTASLPRSDANALLPPDLAALATLFPVLRRSPAIAARLTDTRASPIGDPLEAKRRAALALRLLLARVAERVPLVLVVEDLRGGDVDSASLLLDVLAPPNAPELLFLATYRDEDAASIELVAALKRRMATGDPTGDVRELWVGPLGDRETRSLARALLGAREPAADPEAPPPALDDAPEPSAFARVSGGSPLAVVELARFARAEGRGVGPLSLEAALRRRIERLPEAPRRLLEIAALADRAIALRVLERAASVRDPGALALLRAGQLVSAQGTSLACVVVVAHASIAAAARARLGADDHRRDSYALAVALEASGTADPALLFVHFDAAGDAARARAFAEAAAQRADHALAFDRAASLYGRALEGAPDPEPLRVALGTALARAGRGAEAGRVFLEAASRASARPAEALDLRRRAAEQLLRAGHLDAGMAALREALAAVGLSWPEGPTASIVSLAYRRAQRSLRGLDFVERPSEASPDELARIDVCWSAARALDDVDLVRSADLQARGLHHALAAGEPVRVAQSLAREAIVVALEGGAAGPARAAELVERAGEVAARTGDAYVIASVAGARASAAFCEQRFEDTVELVERAIQLFRAARGDVVGELGSLTCRTLLPALWFLGRVEALALALPIHLKEADDLGALGVATTLRTSTLPRLRFAEDRPFDARNASEDAIGRWSSRNGLTPQHAGDFVTRVHAALYLGDGPGAQAELDRTFKDLDRSFVSRRVEAVRIDAAYLRGSVAVAAAPPGREGLPKLAAAERAARTLDREARPYAHALAAALRASIARERGELERAVTLFEQAARGFDALGMGLHAAAARYRRGAILRGEEGHDLVDVADGYLRRQGIVRPDRLIAMLLPARSA